MANCVQVSDLDQEKNSGGGRGVGEKGTKVTNCVRVNDLDQEKKTSGGGRGVERSALR